jgi:hypothetical protein
VTGASFDKAAQRVYARFVRRFGKPAKHVLSVCEIKKRWYYNKSSCVKRERLGKIVSKI